MNEPINIQTYFNLPEQKQVRLSGEIRSLLAALNLTIVVLDDDPTGTQTVHDISVLTSWNISDIEEEFKAGTTLFYILTNSRSLPQNEAETLAHTIGLNIRLASANTGRRFLLISRSDSTLRGHFPAEVDAITSAAGLSTPLTVLIPAFIEGKRFTVEDIHYLQENNKMTPVAQTPFAKDPVFGYKNSDLREWVQEKSHGKISQSEITSLSIAEIRTNEISVLLEKIIVFQGKVLIVNATTYSDLEIVAYVLLKAYEKGKEIVFRSAASIVRAISAIEPKPLLRPEEMVQIAHSYGGLIVVGSFIQKTTQQLAYLTNHAPLPGIEIKIDQALNNTEETIAGAVKEINQKIIKGDTVVLFSERELKQGTTPVESLRIGSQVSEVMVSIVQGLEVKPSFIIAKGGITSSDIATRGLHMRKARVLGQIVTGVPVWEAEPGNPFGNIPYVVFPGNVGDESTLYEVFKKLTNEA